jgi:hypothetical protein
MVSSNFHKFILGITFFFNLLKCYSYNILHSAAELTAHQNCINYFQINQGLVEFLFDLSHLYNRFIIKPPLMLFPCP